MKLIDKLLQLGVKVPEKKDIKGHKLLPTRNEMTKQGLDFGWNDCHDQWANLEVPEENVLDINGIRAIIYMALDHEDTYSDLMLVENQSVKNCFNAISKLCADEICSLHPTVKVMSDIEKLAIEYYKWHELNKDNPAMLSSFPGSEDIHEQCVATMKEYFKSQEALFSAIRNHMIKKEE